MSATSRPAATAELPFISVVIPVKDRYDEVRQCLSALSVSAYEKKEVIVVDDGSKIPLCETDLPGKCTVIRFDRSRGPSVARNTGARAAAGTIILFLDSDCILEQDILEKIGSLSLRYPSVAAFNGIYVTPPATESISSRFAALEMNYCFLNPPSTVFTALSAIRREVFIESGGFDESLTSPFADDVLLGWKLEELGYTTMFDFDLRTLHLKQYSFFSYLANSFEHHAVITALCMTEVLSFFSRSEKRPDNHFLLPIVSDRRPINLGIFTALIIWIGTWIINSFFGRPGRFLRFVPGLLMTALIFNNARLFLYLVRKTGWQTALLSGPLMLADIAASSAGFFTGLLRALSVDNGNELSIK